MGAPLGAALRNIGALGERRSSNFQGAQKRAALLKSGECRKERKIERRSFQNCTFTLFEIFHPKSGKLQATIPFTIQNMTKNDKK